LELQSGTGVNWQPALQVELVPPYVLKANSSVTVTIIIAMDTEMTDTTDHDFTFGIGDNTSYIGFIQFDQVNYNDYSPCRRHEGDRRDDENLQNTIEDNAPPVNSRTLSSETTLQIRPAEQWGSCHTEHDEGYTNIANYQRSLDLSNGLFLEMYRHEADEVY